MSDKVIYRELTDGDSACISRLHAHVFGPGRFARTAYRVREQSGAAALVSPLCRAAFLGNRLVASVTMTPVAIGPDCEALLLGPLAVDPEFAGHGQ